jgi:membrane-associated phospholipid phosphatase
MANSRKKRQRKAWNRFGDIGRAVLVGAATLMPLRPGTNPARVSAASCLTAIKFLTKALKMTVPEERPDGDDNESFPSEHAAQCVAAAMIIEREYPGPVGALAYGLAGLVSMSRIEAKKHHPRDVIAGGLIGCAVVLATRQLRLVLNGVSQVSSRLPSAPF